MESVNYSPRNLARFKVLICEPADNIRDALQHLFRFEGFEAHSAADEATAVVLAETHRPSIILASLGLAADMDGFFANARRGNPGALLYGLQDAPDNRAVIRAARAGVIDVFLKPFNAEAMVSGIRSSVQDMLTARGGRDHKLTNRELEVLELLLAGHSNKEAGRLLCISPRTIEVHRARVMEKLGAKNAIDLPFKAMSLMPPQPPTV